MKRQIFDRAAGTHLIVRTGIGTPKKSSRSKSRIFVSGILLFPQIRSRGFIVETIVIFHGLCQQQQKSACGGRELFVVEIFDNRSAQGFVEGVLIVNCPVIVLSFP